MSQPGYPLSTHFRNSHDCVRYREKEPAVHEDITAKNRLPPSQKVGLYHYRVLIKEEEAIVCQHVVDICKRRVQIPDTSTDYVAGCDQVEGASHLLGRSLTEVPNLRKSMWL